MADLKKCKNCWHCKCTLVITNNKKGEVIQMPLEFSDCYCELGYWDDVEVSMSTLNCLPHTHDISIIGRRCKDYDDKEDE